MKRGPTESSREKQLAFDTLGVNSDDLLVPGRSVGLTWLELRKQFSDPCTLGVCALTNYPRTFIIYGVDDDPRFATERILVGRATSGMYLSQRQVLFERPENDRRIRVWETDFNRALSIIDPWLPLDDDNFAEICISIQGDGFPYLHEELKSTPATQERTIALLRRMGITEFPIKATPEPENQ